MICCEVCLPLRCVTLATSCHCNSRYSAYLVHRARRFFTSDIKCKLEISISIIIVRFCRKTKKLICLRGGTCCSGLQQQTIDKVIESLIPSKAYSTWLEVELVNFASNIWKCFQRSLFLLCSVLFAFHFLIVSAYRYSIICADNKQACHIRPSLVRGAQDK